MKYLGLCLLVLLATTALANPAWMENSSKAQDALKASNLDLAEKFLEKALPEAQEVEMTSANKADLQSLCTVFDNWQQTEAQKCSKDIQLEAKRKVDNYLAGKRDSTGDFKKRMAELRQSLDADYRHCQKHQRLTVTAMLLRKKVYGDRDPIANQYQSQLDQTKETLSFLDSLQAITESNNQKEAQEKFVKMLKPVPDHIFVSYFDTPIEIISELRGGGYAFWLGYDCWLRFKSPKHVWLKTFHHIDDEKPDLQALSKMFLAVCPEDKKALLDIDNLKGGLGTLETSTHKWAILLHKKLDIYWYRTWNEEMSKD